MPTYSLTPPRRVKRKTTVTKRKTTVTKRKTTGTKHRAPVHRSMATRLTLAGWVRSFSRRKQAHPTRASWF